MSYKTRRGKKKSAKTIRKNRERKLKVAEYRKYLKSPQWQVFRMTIFELRGEKCERCQNTKKLQIHHKTYARVFNEIPEDVEILCQDCHEKHHGKAPKPKSPHAWTARRIRILEKKAARRAQSLAKRGPLLSSRFL